MNTNTAPVHSAFEENLYPETFSDRLMGQPFRMSDTETYFPHHWQQANFRTVNDGQDNSLAFDVQHHDHAASLSFDLGHPVASFLSAASEEQQQFFLGDSTNQLIPSSSPPSLHPSALVLHPQTPPSPTRSQGWYTNTPSEYNLLADQQVSPPQQPRYDFAGPSSCIATMRPQSRWSVASSDQRVVDRMPLDLPSQNTAVDQETTDASYAKLLYWIMKDAPNYTMSLSDIYVAVQKASSRAKDPNNHGWKNSVRHNLSMNLCFDKAKRGKGPDDEPALKGSHWCLSQMAIDDGIQSTTRFRKDIKRKSPQVSEPLSTKRQVSGAKGGQATRRAQKLKTRRAAAADEARRQAALLAYRPYTAAPANQYPILDASPPEYQGFDPAAAPYLSNTPVTANFGPTFGTATAPGDGMLGGDTQGYPFSGEGFGASQPDHDFLQFASQAPGNFVWPDHANMNLL